LEELWLQNQGSSFFCKGAKGAKEN
jgi:hypothetical protein